MPPKKDARPDLTKPETCWALGEVWAGNERHVCRLCAWDTIEGQADVEHHLDLVHAVGRPQPRDTGLLDAEGNPIVIDDGRPTHIALIEQGRLLGVVDADLLGRDELEDAIAEAEQNRADLIAAFTPPDLLGDAIAGAAAPDLASATTDELHAIAEEAGIDHADLDDNELTDALNDLDPKD